MVASFDAHNSQSVSRVAVRRYSRFQLRGKSWKYQAARQHLIAADIILSLCSQQTMLTAP